MTTISLGILTKNSGAQLEPLLEQCKPYAHEIIIIDGFSTDNTRDIAQQYGAKIYMQPFNGSFAQLRNLILDLSTAEYVLFLDADETLEDVASVFNKTYTEAVYALPRHNFIDYVDMPELYPDYQSRLIKVSSNVRYENDIHEIINVKPIVLSTHIIHDKQTEFGIKYEPLHSALKYKNNRWIEYTDVMTNEYTYGAYNAEYFQNGDVARWFSSDARIVFDLHTPEASELEIRISTFGEYETVDLSLYTFSENPKITEELIGKLDGIRAAGVYHIPLTDSVIQLPARVKLVITGNNRIKNIGDERDLCIFVDYIALTSNYVSGILKLPWDESKKFIMHGFSYDVAIMACVRASGWWETDNLAWMHKLIQSDDVCLDIGANIGALTIPMAALCNKVYAFEAGFEIYGMLKSNLIANQIENVEPLYLAISNKKDIVYFHHNKNNVGGSYVTPIADKYATSAVQAVRLDTWAKENLKRLDFIKCDIEGFEVKFMRGAKQTLKKYKPTMLIEFNPIAYSNNSKDDTIEDLWKELTSIYDYIYVIEGADTLRRVNTIEEACQRIDGTTRTLEDLLCSASEI